MINEESLSCQSDIDQIDYNDQEEYEQQFLLADLQSQQITSDLDSRQNYYPIAQNTYEQSIDLNTSEQGFNYESEQEQEEYGSLEQKFSLTSQPICHPQDLNTDQQSTYPCYNELQCQNSDAPSYIKEQDIQETIYNQDSKIQEFSESNELNDKNKYKVKKQESQCKKKKKISKVNSKLNEVISMQNSLCSENQTSVECQSSEKNIDQDKYKKIYKRLQQRYVKHIQQTILFQNIIMETLADKLSFEKYEQQINDLKDQDSKQIRVDIIQSLQSDFYNYQNQIVGLGQIEKYIVLLTVKHAIYNFISDQNLIDGDQFQGIKEDLLYFFTSLSDQQVIMEQAKDFIIKQKIFKLSCGVKDKITIKVMNQLYIYREYYKSNKSGYYNYIKQNNKEIKNEEYMKIEKKKDNKTHLYFGKKILQLLLRMMKEQSKISLIKVKQKSFLFTWMISLICLFCLKNQKEIMIQYEIKNIHYYFSLILQIFYILKLYLLFIIHFSDSAILINNIKYSQNIFFYSIDSIVNKYFMSSLYSQKV
ncbi:hypothetical protein pb186bvf_002709 [Paramecium bursaria]